MKHLITLEDIRDEKVALFIEDIEYFIGMKQYRGLIKENYTYLKTNTFDFKLKESVEEITERINKIVYE